MNPGDRLGDRYRLVSPLGAGGTAVVWQARDEVLGRAVAVKLLAGQLAGDTALLRRLRVEARLAARLHHPHIVGVFDFAEVAVPGGPPVPYIVLELVAGRPLSELLAAGPLRWPDAVRVCAQVASALTAAHACGIVHRDVKPDNVMLTGEGAKLVDFGISATIGEADIGSDGQLLGTPAYLAPERLDGGPVRAACDVYGLGLLLYQSLTGELPWPQGSLAELLAAIRHAGPVPPPAVPGLPAEVAELCRRCLAQRPADRPASVEVAHTLAAAAARPAPAPVATVAARPAPAPVATSVALAAAPARAGGGTRGLAAPAGRRLVGFARATARTVRWRLTAPTAVDLRVAGGRFAWRRRPLAVLAAAVLLAGGLSGSAPPLSSGQRPAVSGVDPAGIWSGSPPAGGETPRRAGRPPATAGPAGHPPGRGDDHPGRGDDHPGQGTGNHGPGSGNGSGDGPGQDGGGPGRGGPGRG
jgi:serine/threonine-protein kinase